MCIYPHRHIREYFSRQITAGELQFKIHLESNICYQQEHLGSHVPPQGRDSFYSWFPTGENQFVPGDSIDTQVVPWNADCEPRFSAMSVCLRLHLWSFPSCLGRSCREEKPFGHLSCVLSVDASSAAHVHAWGWLAAWKQPWKWKAVLLPAAIHLQSWGALCPTALAPLHALLLLLHSPGYSVC